MYNTVKFETGWNLPPLLNIGVGTGGGRGARAPPIFTLETLLIFMHAAQIAVIAEYITFSPPPNGIASYAYAKIVTCTVHAV